MALMLLTLCMFVENMYFITLRGSAWPFDRSDDVSNREALARVVRTT